MKTLIFAFPKQKKSFLFTRKMIATAFGGANAIVVIINAE